LGKTPGKKKGNVPTGRKKRMTRHKGKKTVGREHSNGHEKPDGKSPQVHRLCSKSSAPGSLNRIIVFAPRLRKRLEIPEAAIKSRVNPRAPYLAKTQRHEGMSWMRMNVREGKTQSAGSQKEGESGPHEWGGKDRKDLIKTLPKGERGERGEKAKAVT